MQVAKSRIFGFRRRDVETSKIIHHIEEMVATEVKEITETEEMIG